MNMGGYCDVLNEVANSVIGGRIIVSSEKELGMRGYGRRGRGGSKL